MPMNAPYMLGHVVDHERDNNPIESFAVHSLYVGLVERSCLGLSCYDLDISRVMFLMHR